MDRENYAEYSHMLNPVCLVKRFGFYSAGNERPRRTLNQEVTCLDWDHPGSSVENGLVGGLKRSQHRLNCLSAQQLFTVAKTTNKQESIPQVAANEWSGARGELCFLSATILGSTSYAYSSTKSCNYSNKQSGKMWHGVISALAGAQAGSTKVERKFLLGSWNKIVDSEVQWLWWTLP